jgi:DNA topoisomerase-2
VIVGVFFPITGKFINVRTADNKKKIKNDIFIAIKKIYGLQEGKIYNSLNELRVGHLMMMTDADEDGEHIKMLILNMIEYFWPSLLKLNFLIDFHTPEMIVETQTQRLEFYNKNIYDIWWLQLSNEQRRYWTQIKEPKHIKGLGSLLASDVKRFFSHMNMHISYFTYDGDRDKKALELAFGKHTSVQKMELINNLNIFQKKEEQLMLTLLNKTNNNNNNNSIQIDNHPWIISIKKYKSNNNNNNNIFVYDTPTGGHHINHATSCHDKVYKDLVKFWMATNTPSIPRMMDNCKPGQRKILYGSMRRRLTREIKVAQLAGYVAETMAYHHGQQSLSDTIIKLAQNFVGSNNINLLVPSGQFSSRAGENAASDRYLFTCLTKICRLIFRKEDDPLLTLLIDEGKYIEPLFLLPIIPMVLVNGANGIGTGIKTNIPSYHPTNIVSYIQIFLDNLKDNNNNNNKT